MSSFADVYKGEVAESVKELPEWIRLGCGEKEYMCEEKKATFPADKCPDECPDLSNHSNIMAEVLVEKPELYKKYKDETTALGEFFKYVCMCVCVLLK